MHRRRVPSLKVNIMSSVHLKRRFEGAEPQRSGASNQDFRRHSRESGAVIGLIRYARRGVVATPRTMVNLLEEGS